MSKIKALILLSVVAVAAILGTTLTVFASDNENENSSPCQGPLRFRFLSDLTEDQRTQLKAKVQEFKAEIKAMLEDWGVEVPEFQGPQMRGPGLLSDLDEGERTALKEMIQDMKETGATWQEIREAIAEEFGIEVPEFQGLHMRGRGHRFHRPHRFHGPSNQKWSNGTSQMRQLDNHSENPSFLIFLT